MTTEDIIAIRDLIARRKAELQPIMDVIAALEAALAAAQAACTHEYIHIDTTPRYHVLQCTHCLQVINER